MEMFGITIDKKNKIDKYTSTFYVNMLQVNLILWRDLKERKIIYNTFILAHLNFPSDLAFLW